MTKTYLLTVLAISMAISGCQAIGGNQAKTDDQPTGIVGADAHAPERATGLTEQRQVIASDFMVASANPLATQAGYDILKQGGSAADAMVAVQTTLSLVEPQSSGLGGGAFVLYWDNSAKTLTTFDGRETAPMRVTPELFLDKEGQPLKFMEAVVGGRSVGTPAIPKLMEAVHQRYGVLPWKALFDTPINLAKQGFEVSPRLAISVEQNQQYLSRYPETAAYFLPNGMPLKAGSLLKNPDFADSVQALATQGAKALHTGKYAQNIVSAVQNAKDNPGQLSLQDLSDYQVVERPPVCVTYRVYEVCGMGAPSSGGIAVGQILGILNEFSPNQVGYDAEGLRRLGDASRLAFADRDVYLGDPDFVPVPTHQLISKDYLKQRSQLLEQSDKALPSVSAGDFIREWVSAKAIELPSTSHISIVDKAGNVLSMTTSIENAFGSTLMANGYLLNNELTDFSFEPTQQGRQVANRVEPGKRPRSSMAPTIVFKEGKPYMAIGSPGGSRIIGYVAKTIVAHSDWNMPIQDAISAPNLLNRFGSYELEAGTAATEWQQALTDLGYKTEVRELNSGVQAIVIEPSRLVGGADPRREGRVMGD
ncbi:gamma-glutamyltransferase [Moraxella canis]|uniref:Glutathione hydrolase proenzyme n=1 Tax=Moraxella canis TaxID=90239 RepID=A0A1S9ZP26_9GAMM|nr:gamma-glutamyltransferase [Moraxella canis]OOR85295.1 gamma-glutamyltransferase [Moraxella canis]